MTCCKRTARVWARENDSGLLWLVCDACGRQWRAQRVEGSWHADANDNAPAVPQAKGRRA